MIVLDAPNLRPERAKLKSNLHKGVSAQDLRSKFQPIYHLCRNIQGRSCVRGQDVSQEMGRNTDRLACPCSQSQPMEKDPQQLSHTLGLEITQTPARRY